MSSGELAARLWRRAAAMLEGARWRLGRGEYDLACFEAEQAAQLALKSLLYELLGSAPRVHDLGELLGLLYRALAGAGLGELAGRIASFAQEQRRRIWLLSDAYYRGRYGLVDYERGEAEECVGTAARILELVRGVREALEAEAQP